MTFTFTDAKATNGDTDNVTFNYYEDQYADLGGHDRHTTTIKYTTDGMGSDFKTKLDGKDTEAGDYKASDVTIVPLADTVAERRGNDGRDLNVDNGRVRFQRSPCRSTTAP